MIRTKILKLLNEVNEVNGIDKLKEIYDIELLNNSMDEVSTIEQATYISIYEKDSDVDFFPMDLYRFKLPKKVNKENIYNWIITKIDKSENKEDINYYEIFNNYMNKDILYNIYGLSAMTYGFALQKNKRYKDNLRIISDFLNSKDIIFTINTNPIFHTRFDISKSKKNILKMT